MATLQLFRAIAKTDNFGGFFYFWYLFLQVCNVANTPLLIQKRSVLLFGENQTPQIVFEAIRLSFIFGSTRIFTRWDLGEGRMELGKPTWQAKAAESLRAVAAPIFAATFVNGNKGGIITVHVSSVAQKKSVESSIRSALGMPVRVRFHSAASLTAPRSLEKLVRRFKCDEIIYDPTEAMTRAKALVDGAASVRASLGSKLAGVFYAPRLRTLYVALSSKALAVGEKVKIAELADIERNILSALRSAFAGQATDCPAVRVGFGIPRTELVPVDQMSVTSFGRRLAQAVSRYWKPAAIAAMLGFGSAGTAAAREPAVSAPNLKVVATAGETSSDSAWVIGGGLTLPLGQEWGLQVEGGAAGVGDDNIYGTAAHIFTRDPDKYLLGLFAAYASEDQFDLEATRVGAEAEIYLDQVSILAKAGYQFSDTVTEGFVGDIELVPVGQLCGIRRRRVPGRQHDGPRQHRVDAGLRRPARPCVPHGWCCWRRRLSQRPGRHYLLLRYGCQPEGSPSQAGSGTRAHQAVPRRRAGAREALQSLWTVLAGGSAELTSHRIGDQNRGSIARCCPDFVPGHGINYYSPPPLIGVASVSCREDCVACVGTGRRPGSPPAAEGDCPRAPAPGCEARIRPARDTPCRACVA
jgi:hypothetical protein